MKRLATTLFLATSFLTGTYVGEHYQPFETSRENKRLYNISAEDGTPEHFRSYQTKIDINEKGRAVLYFGSDSTGVYRPVNADGTVGTVGSNVDEWWQESKERFKELFRSKNEEE